MNTPESSRFRFTVRSAEEAVTVLREKLGPRARVVSVRQIQGKGLARFLSAPNLEVIAEVAPENFVVAENKPEPVAEATAPAPAPEPEPQPEPPPVSTPESGLASLLRAGGLPATLIARMKSEARWKRWECMPPAEALTLVGLDLRETWQKRSPRPLTQYVAFIGSPGAGKTTALCKQLAADVFVRRRQAVVLKLDLEHANPDDGLVVFCKALGVPFARELAEVPALEPHETLYVDVPGVTPRDFSQTVQLRDALDSIPATTRVLVLNAAYDAEVLKNSRAWGAELECSHTAFTHLDELTHWAKLWDFLLPPAPAPLFLSTGQSVAGDLEENVFNAVLARTFPAPVNPLRAAA
jgi:flagellar biosynthesis protein FlhF